MAADNIRLSFIIPFYNVEEYIEECIRSIYNQDIETDEYEVICIDDYSPDNSRDIVEKLQKEYSTLKLYTCPENLKQGGARNIGIENAKGKYIWFVDSDDTIEPNCLKKLLEIAEQDELEILDFDFKTDNDNGFRKGDIEYEMGPCTGEEYVFDSRVKWDWKCCSVCGEIIKKELINDNKLRFAEQVQYEDDDFAMQLYAYAKRVKHIPIKSYHYRFVASSTMHISETLVHIEYRIAKLERYAKILSNNSLSFKWNYGIIELCNSLCYEILNILPKLNTKEKKKYFRATCKRIKVIQPFIKKKMFIKLQNKLIFYFYSIKKTL